MGRNKNSAKKPKRISRSSLRLKIASMQKNGAVNFGKTNMCTGCSRATFQQGKVPRTVELLSNQSVVGDERIKLLFVMALGLTPNSDRVHRQGPRIRIERLNPIVLAKDNESLKDVGEVPRSEKAEEFSQIHNSSFYTESLSAVQSIAQSSITTRDSENVELVDLVSSSEDESSVDDERLIGALSSLLVQRKRQPSADSGIYNGDNELGNYGQLLSITSLSKKRPRKLSKIRKSFLNSLCEFYDPKDIITID